MSLQEFYDKENPMDNKDYDTDIDDDFYFSIGDMKLFAKRYAKAELEEMINYIENDAEIAMPLDELIGKTKKEYGLVLIKYLCIELRKSITETPLD